MSDEAKGWDICEERIAAAIRAARIGAFKEACREMCHLCRAGVPNRRLIHVDIDGGEWGCTAANIRRLIEKEKATDGTKTEPA